MKKIEKSEVYGIIGAIVSGVILLALLFLLKISFNIPPEEEVASIRMGDSPDGGGQGYFEPSPMSAIEPTPAASEPEVSQPAVSAPDPVQTQHIQESIEVIEARRKEQERRAEAQRQQQEQRARELAEQQRIAAERRAEEARIAEEQRIAAEKAAQAEAIRNRTGGAFGGGSGSGTGGSGGTGSGTGTGTGSGDGTGAGNQGNPFGTGTAGRGAVAKVGTRNVVGGIPQPNDNKPVEGIIVVDIVVDETGKVTEATFGKGTNITEPATRSAALASAKKTVFTKGTKPEVGTITYRYTLN